MKMNKKGFTLIELLAIIVILAIIALIGTPIVTNIINTTRISSAERTCDGLVQAVQNLYSVSVLKDPNFGGATIYFNGGKMLVAKNVSTDTWNATLDYKGTIPQNGLIRIDQDGTYHWENIVVNTYGCSSDANGKYSCKQYKDATHPFEYAACPITETNGVLSVGTCTSAKIPA